MRSALLLSFLALWSNEASAFTGTVGEIAVIEDSTGEIHTNMAMINRFCRETAKVFYQHYPDDFDTIIAFTTKELNFLLNVYQGTIVKTDIDGIGLAPFDWTSQYGSAGRLGNCVKMGELAKLPDDPDDENTYTYHLTGVEILAHEYSHQWLMWLDYDKDDGAGAIDLLRGYESGGPNGHWNHYANSHSVMYGSCITDLGNGQFELAGCDRHYNDFELYTMGLLDASQVGPIWFVDTGDAHGNPSLPLKKGQSNTTNGTKVEVTIDEIVRALGPRSPTAANSPQTFRVAFVLVSEQGISASSALIAKMDTYRSRFVQWFSWATNGLGQIDTQIASLPPLDAGIIDAEVDAGEPDAGNTPDAGTALDAQVLLDAETDAGETVIDAGSPDLGFTDSGLADAAPSDAQPTVREPAPEASSCGCTSTDQPKALSVGIWRR